MANIDVFNGDADGICSLIQLRLAKPQDSALVTGIKRDINLLEKVKPSVGDAVTVLDISMQKNHADLQRILSAGARVFYADHHNPGEIIEHPALETHIDTSPSICTALIVDRYLNGQFHLWAITAAFGDNLTSLASKLASEQGLDAEETSVLQQLGIYLNYNGYGASLDDLFFHPADLYQACVKHHTPFDFITQNSIIFETLRKGYHRDIDSARAQKTFHETDAVAALRLPDEKWARRVSGVFSNQLSNEHPDRAHLIMTEKEGGDYLVSIRAPLSQLEGADEVAGRFKTGGGRKGAAGINSLKEEEIPLLIDLMEQRYG
ncbi:DHH family phosphoesterase [Methylophaga sp.]|uniref:DHHA1 domain-containing protein n=1 Tax=Methylophaga sp. TaxID=2024840 RepID=UPI001400AEB9|nr:DHH family phosphoesterase [Methylophaga sp.]MTI64707.1 DHH family phosphoesterase [Methylophaga sp.]